MGLLRLLLSISVVAAHTAPIFGLPFIAGGVAVQIFFVISGFYMQMVLDQKYTAEKLGRGWVFKFYVARYLRLMPIYLIVVVLTLIGAALLKSQMVPVWQDILALPSNFANNLMRGFLVFTNATMLFQDATMFLAVHDGQAVLSANFADSAIPVWTALVVPQGWSLGAELSFYLLCPVLLRLQTRWFVALTLLLLSVRTVVIGAFDLGSPWNSYFFPFELGWFLCGSLAFRFRDRLSLRALCAYRGSAAMIAYALVLAIAFSLPADALLAGFGVPPGKIWLIVPALVAVVIPFVFLATAHRVVDRWIGDLSYPVYVAHWLMLFLVWSTEVISIDSPYLPLLVTALTLGISVPLVVFEHRVVDPWRQRVAIGR